VVIDKLVDNMLNLLLPDGETLHFSRLDIVLCLQNIIDFIK